MRSRGSEKVCFTCLPPPCRALAPSSFGICVDRIRTGRAWPAGCAERLSTMRFRKLRMSIVRALCRDREWVWVLPEHCFRFLETSANCERFWLCVSLPCGTAREREAVLSVIWLLLASACGRLEVAQSQYALIVTIWHWCAQSPLASPATGISFRLYLRFER